ncbi:hypothetical protein AQUCO_00900680v1 [Aquilegia coerulea]|uniref:Trafficking protein particle complex subunit 8 n=1 Tax=Aquilegia coerulea TaxID=218851 RepID=A0A2G5EF12_AQUCA|nr:hypothetical protein AQUCO_00900680v1 [Aquilegia coerulea]
MDPTSSNLGKMLLEEITPVVMILRTPLVEESCRKNGLSFIQMIQPFSNFNNIDVPVRTASDQPYRLHQFKLRLHYASDICQPNVEAAEEHLKEVVTRASDNDLTDLNSDPPQLESLLRSAESESQSSRFQIFNKELIRASSFSEHEAFDHPVACLLVVSSKDDRPVNKFVDFFNTNQFPSLLNNGAMDPKILKYYLLIHDNQDGTSENATNVVSEMRGTFGASDCRMLCINSAENGSKDWQDNPWSACNSDALLGQDLGCFLNMDDLDEIKDLMQELSSKHIIPHMEQKVRVLNQQVSATRKGFRNQIKNLWWRKGKEDTPDAPTGTMYTFSSIESQIRVLGDYAFMLRDYELALSNYRLLSTDYKLDKAWKRYAGVQEMMALTYFMLDQSRKDAEYCMENSFSTYLKLGSSGQRNATRCGLWWTEMLKARDQYKEAASVYFRISNEEPSLHAAVMLEQASYCYLLSKPPMLRKYGFHLVLSGNRYYISDQRKHAIRAYRSALSVYKGNAWRYINDHVHYHIGKWYAVLGIHETAIKHMMLVLACGHQSIATQELFFRDFLQIVQKLGKTFEVFRLQLPVISMPSLKVIFEDHRTYASSAAVDVKESLWKSLEEDLVPSIPIMRTNWLESQPKKKYKDSNICVAGEAIKVDLEFKNPLKISLSVSGVSLICQLSEKTDSVDSEVGDQHATDVDGHLSTSVLQNDLELKKLKSSWELNSCNSSIVLSEVDFTLGGCEKTKVHLAVTPQLEGVLNIVGVRWKLSGSTVGYHNFDAILEKKRVKGKRRTRKSPSSNLKFTVIKSLPKLEGSIINMPERAYAGELRLVVLELRNQSKYPVKNLKMKISHPRFLYPGSFEDIEAKFPSCLEKQIDCKLKGLHASSIQLSSNLLFSFPEDVTIQGGTTFSWPLWLRAASPGSIPLYISIYYEMENVSSDMRYRTLRIHYNIEVLPSLDVSVQINPSPSRLSEFLVRMDIVNKTGSESFQLKQLSFVGCEWEISSLPPNGTACTSQLLIAGQALSSFFKLKCDKSTCEPTTSSLSTLVGSDVSFGPEAGVLFDISRTPLADFHRYERLHQEKAEEGDPSNIDFILIAQPQESIGGSSAPARLFCHHACHCSIASQIPISWRMDGPQALHHDFSSSFCEIGLCMTIHNSSDYVVSVRIHTPGPQSSTGQLSDATGIAQSPRLAGNQEGWYDVSLVNDIKVTSDVMGTLSGKPASLDSTAPYIWSASSSTKIEVGPMSSTKVPLQVSLFSPGTYNLSNYNLHWSLLLPSNKDGLDRDQVRQTSGTIQGHSYYLTVLQSP